MLEWPKSGMPTTPSADKDAEQQGLSVVAGGDATWYSHSGKASWVFQGSPVRLLLSVLLLLHPFQFFNLF